MPMRYYEIIESSTPTVQANRDAEKRRLANVKRDSERQKKSDAAHRYQEALRTSNEKIRSANKTISTIKSS